MKRLLVIALSLFTLVSVAQEKRKKRMDRKGGSELRKQMTPSEIADLKAKKMTLMLDLTDAQQKKVHAIILNQAEENEALRKKYKKEDTDKKEKPSKEEFMKMQNHRLDQQIKMKRQMKALLTPEQYAKFEKIKPKQHKKRAKRGKKQNKKR